MPQFTNLYYQLRTWLWSQATCVQILGLPLTSCLILNNLLNPCACFLTCNSTYLIQVCCALIKVEHLECCLGNDKYSRNLSYLFLFMEVVWKHTYNSHKSAWCVIFNWPGVFCCVCLFLPFKMHIVTALNTVVLRSKQWEVLLPVNPGSWAWIFKEFFLCALSSLTKIIFSILKQQLATKKIWNKHL